LVSHNQLIAANNSTEIAAIFRTSTCVIFK